jgi:DUF2937 family protein
VRALLQTAICVLVALLFCQAPEFVQQYSQRLGGTVDELELIVRHFDGNSGRSGYDRNGVIALMARNPEQLVRDQSTRMSKTVQRLDNLRSQQVSMGRGTSLTRVTAFATGNDSELASRTWKDFRFALPLSVDGIIFAVAGFLLAAASILGISFGLGLLMPA